MSERPLAAASRRLREVPGFPRRPGRPRTRPENRPGATTQGSADGHNADSVAQPLADTRENERDHSAGVQQTPVVALELPANALVTVAPAILSVENSATYLGVSARTIESYVAAGLLVPVRLPSPRGGRHLGRVLLERAELDRLVARSRGRT